MSWQYAGTPPLKKNKVPTCLLFYSLVLTGAAWVPSWSWCFPQLCLLPLQFYLFSSVAVLSVVKGVMDGGPDGRRRPNDEGVWWSTSLLEGSGAGRWNRG